MADKPNKLNSKFSTVSAFWEPETPEHILTGTLTNDEEGLTFATSPRYGYGDRVNPLAAAMLLSENVTVTRIPVMHGFSADGICTLCHLMGFTDPRLQGSASGHWIEANSYRAITLIGGMHIGGLDDKCLTSARFTFTGIAEWQPISHQEIWDTDHLTLQIPLTEREVFSFCMYRTKAHISLKVMFELDSTEDDGGRVTRPIPFIEIKSPEPESLSWYFGVGDRLENFFSLLLGTSLAMETIFIYRGDESGHVISKRRMVAVKVDPFDSVRCTPSQLAHAVAVWLSQSEEFRTVENLALGVLRKSDLFYETEFLSITQALEGFHRATSDATYPNKAALRKIRKSYEALLKQEGVDDALASRLCDSMAHANDPSFRSRLSNLCGRLSELLLLRMEIDTSKLIRDVVATRNFYTHAGKKISKNDTPPIAGPALFFLNQKLRALLRAVLLLHIELPEAQICELIVREATRWR